MFLSVVLLPNYKVQGLTVFIAKNIQGHRDPLGAPPTIFLFGAKSGISL